MADTPRIVFLRQEHGPVYRGYHRFARRAETSNPYLELIRVLSEAAALEHSLMVAYLFAMFSIKDRYSPVRGDVTLSLFMEHRIGGQPEDPVADADHSWLAVCTEEMQHLSLANGFWANSVRRRT
jgi:Ferritin-like